MTKKQRNEIKEIISFYDKRHKDWSSVIAWKITKYEGLPVREVKTRGRPNKH